MTVEDAFGLTFQVALTDAMGCQIIFDLKENGQSISVTKENREVTKSIILYSFFLRYLLGIRPSLQ